MKWRRVEPLVRQHLRSDAEHTATSRRVHSRRESKRPRQNTSVGCNDAADAWYICQLLEEYRAK